jgi:hypothetical protein
MGAGVTVYEGAVSIVGDGRRIENATVVVDGTRITQAGASGTVKAPADAKRVSLAGKTVMPMMVDTHVHLSGKRETMVRDLKQRAYWGVSAAMSMGTDNLELLPMRNETIPGAARFLSAGRGITRPEPLRPTFQINSEDEARKAVQQNAAMKVEIIKFWVDDRNGKVRRSRNHNMPPSSTRPTSTRSAPAHLQYGRRQGLMRAGLDSFAHGVRDGTSTTKPWPCSSSVRTSS